MGHSENPDLAIQKVTRVCKGTEHVSENIINVINFYSKLLLKWGLLHRKFVYSDKFGEYARK
jgi:hypothetical protein